MLCEANKGLWSKVCIYIFLICFQFFRASPFWNCTFFGIQFLFFFLIYFKASRIPQLHALLQIALNKYNTDYNDKWFVQLEESNHATHQVWESSANLLGYSSQQAQQQGAEFFRSLELQPTLQIGYVHFKPIYDSLNFISYFPNKLFSWFFCVWTMERITN